MAMDKEASGEAASLGEDVGEAWRAGVGCWGGGKEASIIAAGDEVPQSSSSRVRVRGPLRSRGIGMK